MKQSNRNIWKKMAVLMLSLSMCCGMFGFGGEKGAGEVKAASAGDRTPIRVDIDKDENRPLAWSEQFENWKISKGSKLTTTINGVTFTLSNGGTTGGDVKGALYKGLLRDGDDTSPRLTADGVLVDFGSEKVSGGTIKLEISGLEAGVHTLKTWHSFFDLVKGSSMTLLIDGEEKAKIASVTRANTDDEAAITFSQFEAAEGRTVTVLVKPNGDGEYDSAVLNAFAIDDADPENSIKKASPKDGETHFQPEEGLSWEAAQGAVSHDVYLGTDYDAVNAATVQSPEFKGNQTQTTFALQNCSHMETYYWRIDEHTDKGVIKGSVMSFEVVHLAFPSAEGYGRFAKGGRGGRVIEVTNLNDSGPGSLREAVEVEKGPRIVVFRVGGVIQLESRLKVPADGGNVYIAGQTAPGDGITLTHHAFGIFYAEDVIIRHVRLRVGDANGVSTDGMGMAGANHSIIDHCSISWTTDEGTSSRGAKNITFQHNLIAEALNNSVHYDADDRDKTEKHSFAGSISGNIGSYHHNLLVNCTGRNWSLAGGMEQDGVTYAGKLDVRNNVVYNFRDRTTDGGVKRINFVNNYYKKGAVSRDMKIFTIDGNELNTNDMQMAYLSGNMLVDKTGKVLLKAEDDAWEKGRASSAGKNSTTADVRSNEPFFPSYVETETAEEAYASVLANVGATVPKQDYLDARYVEETRLGTSTLKGSKDGLEGIIDSQEDAGGYPVLKGGEAPADTDHDGMPDDWEIAHGLDAADADDRNGMELSPDGYTNLEMYLNELAGDEVVFRPYTPGVLPSQTPEKSAEPVKTPEVVPSRTPEVSDKPDANASEKPEASVSPDASGKPGGNASEKPEASSNPKASEKPVGNASENPEASSNPKASEKPVGNASEKPGASSNPKASEKPGSNASEKPGASVSPEVSDKPGGNASEEPGASPNPDASEKPSSKPSEKPGISVSPGASSKPGSSPEVPPSPPSTPVPSAGTKDLLGDVNQNKKIDLEDAQLTLKRALNLIKLNPQQQLLADVDKDKIIGLRDAQLILKKALNLISDYAEGSLAQ